jgi:hypothetical protein
MRSKCAPDGFDSSQEYPACIVVSTGQGPPHMALYYSRFRDFPEKRENHSGTYTDVDLINVNWRPVDCRPVRVLLSAGNRTL